jgi:RHS repeat-associated protein
MGGDQNGANQRLANYMVNTLNQITNRYYPGTNDVVGVALATNTVAVNGQAAWRKGEYFWSPVSTNNTSSAEWEQVTVSSGGGTSTGGMYVPETPETFTYDLDGNLITDGRWKYIWDAENRLVAMTNNTGVGPLYGLTFTYDAKGRRIQKTVTTNGTSFVTLNFLYDGWNPIATLNTQSSILTAFTWGNDSSGSAQGAGGVGGLLTVTYRGTAKTNCYVAYDGNGNVANLINATNGMLVANYEYGPFGEVIRSTGPMAKVNPFRFSTKYQDDESDLLSYGYRYYKASTGTWLSRDPFAENGGDNLYGFVHDDPVDLIDTLGLGDGNPIPPTVTSPGPVPPCSQPPIGGYPTGPFPPIGGYPTGPFPPIGGYPTGPFPPIGGYPTGPLPPIGGIPPTRFPVNFPYPTSPTGPTMPTCPGNPITVLLPGGPSGNYPSVPVRQPPGGAPTTTASAAVGGLQMCACMWASVFDSWQYQGGLKFCKSQLKSSNGTDKCCVMFFCQSCDPNFNTVLRLSAYLANKSCAEVQADNSKGTQMNAKCPDGYKGPIPDYEPMY